MEKTHNRWQDKFFWKKTTLSIGEQRQNLPIYKLKDDLIKDCNL